MTLHAVIIIEKMSRSPYYPVTFSPLLSAESTKQMSGISAFLSTLMPLNKSETAWLSNIQKRDELKAPCGLLKLIGWLFTCIRVLPVIYKQINAFLAGVLNY